MIIKGGVAIGGAYLLNNYPPAIIKMVLHFPSPFVYGGGGEIIAKTC
jgi:hypothetical protein